MQLHAPLADSGLPIVRPSRQCL